MKAGKVIFLTVLLFALVFSATAQSAFKGGLECTVNLFIPDGNNYDSLLNPGNTMGITDVSIANQAFLKFDTSGNFASLELCFDFKEYPVADVIFGSAAVMAAYGDITPATLEGIADLVYMYDNTLWTADLTRANVSWYPKGWLNITVGRQSFLTGYGYGWNPLDLANPLKDPSDPKAVLKGVDGISVELIPSYWLSILAYSILPEGPEDYQDICAGGLLTLQLPVVEIKAAGMYGGADTEIFDSYPNAGAAALYADLWGVGVYAEGVVRDKSRRPEITDGTGTLQKKDGPVYSALAGLEYTFSGGVSLALEYFYNGEGWSDTGMEYYSSALSFGSVSGVLYSLYTPLYFARHYILANIMVPFTELQAELNTSAIFSPDSGCLYLVPTFRIDLDDTGNLAASASYSGGFSLYDSTSDEVSLLPAVHALALSLSYYF